MKKNELLNNLNKIAEPSISWMEEAKFRIENRKKIEDSQEITLHTLRETRKADLTNG